MRLEIKIKIKVQYVHIIQKLKGSDHVAQRVGHLMEL